MNFQESYKAAADLIMAHLCGITNTQEEKNAFRYYIPNAVPAWSMFLGGGSDVSNTWHDQQLTELRMNCELRGQFVSAEAAQVWGMTVLQGLPIFEKGNVQWLRLRQGGMLDIGWDVAEMDGKKVVIYEANIGCECVFLTTSTFPA